VHFSKKQEKRSPLKARPLRNPGQSLDEQIQKILDDDVFVYIAISMLVLMLTGLEWWRWLKETPPSPRAMTIVAVAVIGYSGFKIARLRRRLKALRLGRDGEKAVGQYLEQLREKGFRIFHDIVAEGFNIDHVILSPAGVFVVETKTYSKPAKGEAKIVVEGEQVLVNGRAPDRNPIAQATALGMWLRELLKESTGKGYPVRPVVLFPGWYVESNKAAKQSGVWVLNPKALPKYIDNEPAVLAEEDIKLAAFHLSRYIRAAC